MRLDRFLSNTGLLSRKEAAKAGKDGRITVNGEIARRVDGHINEHTDVVCLDGEQIGYHQFDYVWLNKPTGYVSATEDGRLPCVTELLPPPLDKRGLFPCGRLDRDTVGLLLLTNDGPLTHALLSPKRGVEKVYRFTTEAPLPREAEERLLAGIATGGDSFRAALLRADDDRMGGTVTLTEGKYHEVKRMMAALGAPVLTLERIAFAGIGLDPRLARGECRPATDEEIVRLRTAAGLPPNN